MQKIALIGAGGMGRTHAAAYADMPNVELAGIHDTDENAARQLADLYSIPVYADAAALITSPDITAVDICTPTPSHLDYIRMAAESGRHICCEKPLARTLEQAEEAVALCEEAGVILFTAHVLRWFPEYRKLHELIVEGAIGQPVEARTTRAGMFPKNRWFSDIKQSGGVILDLIVHDFDWLRWCFGDVKRVYAVGVHSNKAIDIDCALVTIKFQNGVIAHVEGSWARPSGFSTNVEVAGTGGLLSFNNKDSVPLVVERKIGDESSETITVSENPLVVNPYYCELEHFIECLESKKEPDVKPRDGLEAVRIAEAAIRSIAAGQPISFA